MESRDGRRQKQKAPKSENWIHPCITKAVHLLHPYFQWEAIENLRGAALR